MVDDNNVNNESFDFLSTTKILLGIDDNSKDDALLVYLSIAKNAILNYCNVSELSSTLNFTLCEMTAEVYRENTMKNNIGSVTGSVSSVSEDGRTVSFTNGTEIQASIDDKISKLTLLKRYRKLYRV